MSTRKGEGIISRCTCAPHINSRCWAGTGLILSHAVLERLIQLMQQDCPNKSLLLLRKTILLQDVVCFGFKSILDKVRNLTIDSR